MLHFIPILIELSDFLKELHNLLRNLCILLFCYLNYMPFQRCLITSVAGLKRTKTFLMKQWWLYFRSHPILGFAMLTLIHGPQLHVLEPCLHLLLNFSVVLRVCVLLRQFPFQTCPLQPDHQPLEGRTSVHPSQYPSSPAPGPVVGTQSILLLID